MSSQNQQILKHLQTGKSITPMEALNKYGCFRLASRINDLRNMGYNIQSELVHKNDTKFARYSYVE